jgi:adenylate cyclase
MMWRFNIRKKLLFFSITLAVIPLGIAGRTMIRITQDELKSSANDELSITVEQLSEGITNWYYNTWLAPLLLIRNAIDNERLGVEEKISLLTLGIQDIRDIVGLQLTADGITEPIVAMKAPFATRLREAALEPLAVVQLPQESLAPYFGNEDEVVGELTFIPETDDWLTTIILPLQNRLAERDAVLSARIDLRRLRQFVQNHPFGKTGNITLVDADGKELLAQSGMNYKDFKIVQDALAVLDSGRRITHVGPFARPNGEAMLGAFSFPRPFQWAIILEQKEKDAYLAVAQMVRSLLVWVVVGLAIAIGGAIVFALRISRPIQEIGRVAQEVSTGNLTVRVQGVKSRDEIGDLAMRMNEMIRGLLERFHLEKFVSGETLSAVRHSDEGGVQLGGERRQVTVFFSDIRGFTAFSERVSPEVVVDMLNVYLRHEANIVKAYQGDIDKFVGDELVAVFQGERMVQNAILCALEIQEKMAELVQERPEWQLAVGIGINTGEVVMGAMGSDERMDYTILGDHVNLGARLCSSAGPGQVLVSENTYQHLTYLEGVKLTRLSPIEVKGKAQPVQIYEAVRETAEKVVLSHLPTTTQCRHQTTKLHAPDRRV